MQVATGTVIDGKIVLEGMHLAEGARVTIVTRGADESFTLSAADEDALVESLAEIERGEFVTLDELITSLPRPN
jgi:predicted transcriptional regulator